MIKSRTLLILLLFGLLISFPFSASFADKLSEGEKKIDATSKNLNDLTSQKTAIENKIADLTKNLSATEEDIKDLSEQIADMEAKLNEINTVLAQKKVELTAKVDLRDKIVRNYYKDNSLSILEFFLLSLDASSDGSNLTGFQRASQSQVTNRKLAERTLDTIGFLNGDINQYEKNKKEAEDLKKSLDSQKEKLVVLKNSLASAKAEAKEELNSLDDEIRKVNSDLSALVAAQQKLLREKFGATSESTTVGNDEQAGSTLPNPSFSPAFAFFTYGYPHRVGASQYGMYGRSKAGQSYKEIIKAYFSNVDIGGKCDKGKSIPVSGYGNLKLEDTYLMGIAEVPESWGSKGGYEALKAQVVLARTFALNYTGYYWDSPSKSLKKRSRQVSICTTQTCQVYSGGKKTGLWKQAVNDTCGVVVTYKGNPITSWYASTAGGYTRTSGQVWGGDRPWSKGIRDAKCSGDIFDCAYDGPKYGNSPWFHKAWGVNKSTGNAWMKGSDVEDVFNAFLLSNKDSSYNKYLSPIDKGGWSADKVKSKLNDLGIKPTGKISDVSVKDDGTGYTTSITLKSENYSNKAFDANKFKSVFNLRSSGTLVIWTSFFDVLVK